MSAEEADPKVCFYHTLVPRVFPLKLMPGITPDILRYIGEHYDAIVIEGYGVGGLPFQGDQNFLDALETLTRKGKLVVLATQVMLEGSINKVLILALCLSLLTPIMLLRKNRNPSKLRRRFRNVHRLLK